MGNSKKTGGSGGKGKKKKMLRKNVEAYLGRTMQTSTADAGATARGAIAITRQPQGDERHPYPGIKAARR